VPLCSAALVAAAASWVFVPKPVVAEPARLESRIPSEFGDWHALPDPTAQISLVPENDRTAAVAATYDESLMRTYGDAQGHRVMVALAYGQNQRQEGKIHRPELCYVAQGFNLDESIVHRIPSDAVSSGSIAARRMIVHSRERAELVSYWIRIGDRFPENAVESRLQILGDGLAGHVPDGILFRVSQAVSDDLTPEQREQVFALQEQFMLELVKSLPAGNRRLLIGKA
jgi:EpsI family protein